MMTAEPLNQAQGSVRSRVLCDCTNRTAVNPAQSGELVTTQVAAPHTPRASDSVSLGRSPRICIPNKFLGAADPTGPGTTLWEPLS